MALSAYSVSKGQKNSSKKCNGKKRRKTEGKEDNLTFRALNYQNIISCCAKGSASSFSGNMMTHSNGTKSTV
jgi:hypothetical protein